ncbi:MAG: hypothetical protein JWN48_344 [Myxococcaceae bacterium]|nr:hypothetical protein [Myxococcaceae bacterium]
MISKQTKALGALTLSLSAFACGSDSSATGLTPWSDQRTQVVAHDGTVTKVAPVSGGECVDWQAACLKPADQCGSKASDIVVDNQGKLIDYLCYPADQNLTVDELEAKGGSIPQRENNSVLVFDNLDDGADLTGNVSIDANNVILYGDSPNTAVLDGSLTLDGNNGFVRGIRIQGDVTIAKNNAVLAFCVIEGNLTISGNNAKLLGCDVYGKVTITGNGTKLYANHFVQPLAATGKNTDCKDNTAAHDTNANFILEPNELGAPILCN